MGYTDGVSFTIWGTIVMSRRALSVGVVLESLFLKPKAVSNFQIGVTAMYESDNGTRATPAGYFSTFSLLDPNRSILGGQSRLQKRNRRLG
jgi:hypothetical protein